MWIDISHRLGEGTPVYPGDEALTLTMDKSLDADHFTSYILRSGMHTGTHIDVPMHLVEDERMACDFSVDCFIGEGVLLDVRRQREIDMNERYEQLVVPGSVVLLYTGHDRYFGEPSYFSNHPYVSERLGAFLLSQNIKMLGMDTPSPDYMPHTLHKAFLRSDICMLENLTNLGALLGAKRFEVIALPLKIAAEGSLVRAVCKVAY